MSDETTDQKPWNSADRERLRAVCDRLKTEGTERESVLAGDLLLALGMIRTLERRVGGMKRKRNALRDEIESVDTQAHEAQSEAKRWRERAEKAERERSHLELAMQVINSHLSIPPDERDHDDTEEEIWRIAGNALRELNKAMEVTDEQ